VSKRPPTKSSSIQVIDALPAPEAGQLCAVHSKAGATASLTAAGPPLAPALFKFFGSEGLPRNGTTTLQFSLANPNDEQALSTIGFTDRLPASVLVATPNGLVGTCPGTVTAVAGSGSVSLSGASLATQARCSFHINVTANTSGTKVNTTSLVSSIEAGSGAAARHPPVVRARGGSTHAALSVRASAWRSSVG
jgi:hypothetical protein